MDALSVIASKRDVRRYGDASPPPAVVTGILEAGRVTGSGKNLQRRRFVVLGDSRLAAAEFVTRPDNIKGASLVIAIVVEDSPWADFDAGRAAQNMMLWAWNEGVGSSPNAIADPDGIAHLLELEAQERVSVLLSFGFPPWEPNPGAKSVEEWLAAVDRLPLDELTEYR